MSREAGPYVIRDDDSGHDYVVPVARLQHWARWIGSTDWDDGTVPEYAERIDGSFMILDYQL
jgi:hypothetical protein